MKRIIFPAISVAIVVALVSISFVVFFKEGRTVPDDIIAQDIQKLADIMGRVDAACVIQRFEHQRNYIDFLQVRSFVSSQIGPLNLKHPQAWEGPYINDNPTVQEKFYEVAVTKQGYFIVPGDGVRLSNGKIMGTDIIVDEFADIEDMLLKTDKLLSANGKPLAVRITIGGHRDLPAVSEEAL